MDNISIEVVQNINSNMSNETVIRLVKDYMNENAVCQGIHYFDESGKDISKHVKCIVVDGINGESCKIDNAADVKWFVYKLDYTGAQVENTDDDRGEDINLATYWPLPSSDFNGLWESLVYDNTIKRNLLRYVSTTMYFADKGVDPNIICANKVVLLHGPPGTGKTSLCKALSQKLSISLQDRYARAQLIEINSHSLFSKWFSESGKLVTKMFSKIHELAEDSDALICLLIDEVESLTHARQICMSGNEPSDSIRVVNAVLTQIDQIKKYPNVLILTTSNMTGAIDLAFVDRADIKQYVGLPSVEAIRQIYVSCLKELMKAGIIIEKRFSIPVNNVAFESFVGYDNDCSDLYNVCKLSVGLSGRMLRKIPFLAHSMYCATNTVNLNKFLCAMRSAIEDYKKECNHFEHDGTA